ncbi:hypothetical protein ACP70R_028575 [Stipagrostis hirtigluma subsp. patula]
MTPKWSECSSNSFIELSSPENGECKSTLLVETVPSSTNCFVIPSANRMCSLSAQKKDGNVYKRRKMDKDSNSPTADEEAKETMTQCCTTSKDHSSLLRPIVPPEAMSLNSKAGTTDDILHCEETPGALLESNSGVKDRCIVSSMTPLMIVDKKNAAECPSSNIRPTETINELMSPKDICIAILRNDGLIREPRTRVTTEELSDSDANPLLSCNSCGGLEHSLKMLICDSCEAAFHLSCCIPRIKELPTDEWYCMPCFSKKPKSHYGKQSEGKIKSSGKTNQRPHGMSHIEYMLKDTEPYVSGARIGRDFQAEVPEWSSPTSSSDGYFEEPCELDPAELTKLNGWKKSDQSISSIGNWIQCRETLNSGDSSDKPAVCGKWRSNICFSFPLSYRYWYVINIRPHGISCRAPLYVVQSDDWDCSCCLLWDPAHADCAVPQELKTSEVLKQLKFVNMLKNQLVYQNQKSA